MRLERRKKYLQIALNSTLSEARTIIAQLPKSDRIIVEAGTPLIKYYGYRGIKEVASLFRAHMTGAPSFSYPLSYSGTGLVGTLAHLAQQAATPVTNADTAPHGGYTVADIKMMDRGATEVGIAHEGGAQAVIALGLAPIESLNTFIEACREYNMDSMVDMMNVEYPLAILHALKRKPDVVILHRGVDEETYNKEKQIPLHEIRRIKSAYDIMIAVAGGDTIRDVQRAIFNDADIVIVWKSFYQSTDNTAQLAVDFLHQIK